MLNSVRTTKCFVKSVRYMILLLLLTSSICIFANLLLVNVATFFDGAYQSLSFTSDGDDSFTESYNGVNKSDRLSIMNRSSEYLPLGNDSFSESLLSPALNNFSENAEERIYSIVASLYDNATDTNRRKSISRVLKENNFLWISPGVGMFLAVAPISYSMRAMGERKFCAILLLFSAISTFSLGVALHIDCDRFIIMIFRFLQGICCAGIFPLIGSIAAKWGSLKEQFLFVGCGYLFVQIAPIFSWPLCALLFAYDGRLPYCISSGLSIILAVTWFSFYRDRPQYHSWVSGLELNEIVTGKIKVISNLSTSDQPCGSMVRSFAIWAVWIAAYGHFLVICFIAECLPVFYYTALKFSAPNSLFSATLPLLSMCISIILIAFCKFLFVSGNDRTLILVSNSVSFLVSALFFLLLALISSEWRTRIRIESIFICLVSFLALSIFGFYRSAILIGRFYGQYIIGNIQSSMGLAYLTISLLFTSIIHEDDRFEWRTLFAVISLLLLITAVAFAFFGSANVESWAKDSWNQSSARKMLTLDQIDYNNEECGLIELKRIGSY